MKKTITSGDEKLTPEPWRIGLVEDDPVHIHFLLSALRATSDLVLTHTWPDAEALLAASRPLDIDFLLVDLGLPGLSGLDLILKIREMTAPPPIVVITASSKPDDVFSVIRSGACGYILKTGSPDDFIRNLRQIVQDGVSLSPVITKMIMEEFRRHSVTANSRMPAENSITPREREVVMAVGKYRNAKDAACSLGISHETVRVHMKKVYKKLQVRSASEAVSALNLKNAELKPIAESPLP